jgi:2-polyprenyl-3-methyl-5-hydroxy-6-metoxy-1,4-benzoquinol methylase
MMRSISLTERQKRELEFYEEYSELTGTMEVCFDPISGTETRPWNSYWRVIEIVRQHFTSDSQRLLDFGCGKGGSSITYAKIGYEVFGFDLSPNNISIAERLARKYDLADRTHFSVSVAEKLNYPAEYFDVIVGTDILHHVDINQSLAECSRVLKKGGLAVFHEPVRSPLFDRLRETKFGRWLVPKEASLDRHITHDERKLTSDDLDIIKRFDHNFSAERFLLFSRLDRFIRKLDNKKPSFLEKTDSRLFKVLPFLKKFGGISVLVLRK